MAIRGKATPASDPAALDPAALEDARLGNVDWMLHPRGSVRSRFDAPSGSLAALSMGDPEDPAVILVPGAMGSKEDFSLMLPGLAAAGYFAFSFDLAGQYESAAAGPENLDPPRSRYDYDLFIADLLAVLAVHGPAHVVGYSFAGVVVQLAALRRPDLFRSITLLGCPPRGGQSFRGVSRIGWLAPLVSDRLSADLIVWGVRRNFIRADAGRMKLVNHRFTVTRRDSVRDMVGLMRHAPDLRAALGASTLPKFVAVGEHDVWPVRLHREFAASIGASFAAYGSGHSPCEESPHQLTRDLLRMYRSAAPGTP
ncbi:alpha/beta hydrolase [Arthrobacter sp. zg-Y40]|uniref:alpha/beta fold hydrolase n=1 Tax=unclassified Arthrobacter TaxID=235627 RepID=UPI001D1499F0|nr:MULTISPECIES: alpha/beta hydrolase [unclassified Arthrobacter]MCC3279394.1 alpha/beta hydrolase [Arthrobacter sp. zg-Y40]MDK1327654.1 alpha/beta hydrolase [Arthrobacter sp. zg-Y1143]